MSGKVALITGITGQVGSSLTGFDHEDRGLERYRPRPGALTATAE